MKIRELYTDESKWTQGVGARNADGIATTPKNKEAVAFCLYGALERCYEDITSYTEAENKIQQELSKHLISLWNDALERTFEEVKALVERLDV